MKYDFEKQYDCEKARQYLEFLIKNQKKAEITEKRKPRTLDQNALFHVWISVFADFTGEPSRETCKRDVKRTILGMREVTNRYTGEIQKDDYKTSEMDTKQLSDFMTKFKAWANVEFGCYLPNRNDLGYEDLVREYYRN